MKWVMPGATPEQEQRALDAALEVFKRYNLQPELAAFARHEMQVYESRDGRGPLPHRDAAKGAQVFIEAQNAALEACGAPMDSQERGYIRVDIPDDSWGGYFMRESRVLNWVDPDGPQSSSAN